jgi:hypothetical protein
LDAKFKSEIALFIESYFKTHPEVFKGERGDKGDPLEVDEEELERLVENCMRRMNRRVNWLGGAEPIRRLPAAAVDFAGNVNTVEDLTGSSGSSLVGFMPSGSGAVIRDLQSRGRERVSVLDYITTSLHAGIAARTNTTDLTSMIQAAMDYAFANDKTLVWPAGTYRVDTSVDFTSATANAIEMVGEGEVIIDGTNSTTATLIQLGGTVGTSAALASNVGPDVLVVASTVASSLSAGDVILIEDTRTWSGESANYTHGEFHEVESTSGNDIRLKAPLYDNYVAATSTVYLYNMPRVVVRNIKISRASNHQGLEVIYARDVVLEDVICTGARERGIELEECYGFTLDNCRVTDAWFTGSGTSYGLAIVSCQNGEVIGGKYFGGRHGVAIGGGGHPSRAISLFGSHVSNDRSATTRAFNIHDAAEHITVKGCHIYGGVSGSIRNLVFEGNEVRSGPSRSAFSCGIYGAIEHCIIRNNDIYVVTAGSFGCEIEFAENSATIDSIDISGNTVTGGGSGIVIDNNSKTGLTIGRLGLVDNEVRTTGAAVSVGASGADLTITDVDVSGHYQSNGSDAVTIRPKLGSGTIRLSGHFENLGSARGLGIFNFKHASLQHYRLAGNGTSTTSFFTDCNRVDVDTGYHYNWGANGGLIATISSNVFGVFAVRNVTLDTVTSVPAGGSGVEAITYSDLNGKQVAHRSAAPTTGTWNDGDIVWNTAPAANGDPGWICTTEGTFSAASTTGDTDGSTGVITNVASTAALAVGQYVSVAAGFASTGPFKITALTSTTITVNSNSNSSQTGTAITTPDPTFKAFANVDA